MRALTDELQLAAPGSRGDVLTWSNGVPEIRRGYTRLIAYTGHRPSHAALWLFYAPPATCLHAASFLYSFLGEVLAHRRPTGLRGRAGPADLALARISPKSWRRHDGVESVADRSDQLNSYFSMARSP